MKRLLPLIAALMLAGCTNEPTPAPTASPSSTTAAPSAVPSTPATAMPAGVDQVVRFSIKGKDVSGPEGRVKVDRGETVRLEITSDRADEIHVHSYDLTQKVAAGGTAVITFKATITGVFEVELHGDGLLITKLQVQ